ncbi:hypothetical protein K32_02060 [Kaistia sp. 32K]|nr:hypothetical protein K32_02060 [Kaistia sp. 32K]
MRCKAGQDQPHSTVIPAKAGIHPDAGSGAHVAHNPAGMDPGSEAGMTTSVRLAKGSASPRSPSSGQSPIILRRLAEQAVSKDVRRPCKAG